MANFAPLDPNTPAGGSSSPEHAKPVEPPMEEKLRIFWEKNSRSIFAVCIVALIAVLARGAYGYYQREREASIQGDFATANTSEKLKSFIDQHPDHSLSGIGLLQLGDEAYSSAKYSDAQNDYRRAAAILKHGPFAGRARLGLAVAKIDSGDRSGEQDLKTLANDALELKPVRAEAAFHLATLAIDAGKTDEAAKDLDLVSTIDQASAWSQRAMMMRSTLPASATATPTTSAAIKLPSQPKL